MQIKLELLAPARTAAIGTAAIDCGADAVYIAGPAFGARVAAGNPISEIADLCSYAHRFGARIYATLNTLLREDELQAAEKLIHEYYEAGVDALIVQDMNVLRLNLPPIELHASTQAVVRTPERARLLEEAGFSRIILERQLSMEQIAAIRSAVSCEMEFFVHGALCVCYSGQCYLSEEITGRSANRGCCAQPCRSRYDLVDGDGKVLIRNHTLLSLKDFRLDDRIGDLAKAGICSFKIEGRLKNASYVKNTVRHYSNILDAFIAENPGYCRASYGLLRGGFTPAPELTFNRSFTSCFIDGMRGKWNSTDAARSLGEFIGEIAAVKGKVITLKRFTGRQTPVSNGDGLSFVRREDEVTGMRAEVVDGDKITVKDSSSLAVGMKVYRNLNIKFERELEKNMPRRLIDAVIDYHSKNGRTIISAKGADGKEALIEFEETAPVAEKSDRAMETLRSCFGKISEPYSFSPGKIESDKAYFYSASALNSIRNRLAEEMSRKTAEPRNLPEVNPEAASNPQRTDELMRSKYCIKYELGLCPKLKESRPVKEPLRLVNQNRSFRLGFDCKNCEMIVTL